MMSSKEIYLAEHERITAGLEDEGMDWSDAYDAAGDRAWDVARDRMADMADDVRMRAKERGL